MFTFHFDLLMFFSGINRSKTKCLASLLGFFAVLGVPLVGKNVTPNFVVVYMDDLGWADSSVPMIEGRTGTRSDFYQTPELERLAREGMVFSDAYSPAPVCTPSRNAMLHGMTPARMLNATLNTKRSLGEYRGKITIPQALKLANPEYVTAHFGKWHIPSISPVKAGYDVTEKEKGTGNGEGDFLDDMKTVLPEEDPKRIFSLTKRTKDFISEQVEAGRPFFVQLSHYSVHIWHDSLKETRDKYRALPRPSKAMDIDYLPEDEISESVYKHNWLINYAAMIEDTDRAFGELLNHLDRLGISENTYVIFTSDNGGGLRGNKPLSGAKGDLTEGGIRVPFIIRGPGVPKGRYCSVPTAGWDLLPTYYELAGGRHALPEELDGVSIAAAFHEGDAAAIERPGDALIFHFPWYNGEPESAIRRGEFKLLKNLDTQKTALYRIHDDLSEKRDVSGSYPEVAALMEKQMTDYLNSVSAEKVNELRADFLKNIEGEWLEGAQARAVRERAAAKAGDAGARKKLAETERYIKWLKQEAIFTRKRMAMAEESQ